MSEVCELYAGLKQDRQDKRASNRESSAEMLEVAGVRFESKNGGAHLIVSHGGHTYDFWPGTGLWIMRGSTQRHRGVRRLLNQLGVAVPVLDTTEPEASHA